MAKHTDLEGDTFEVWEHDSGIVAMDTTTEVWLTESMVKDLIDDLAAQIGYRAILQPSEVTGWTNFVIPADLDPENLND